MKGKGVCGLRRFAAGAAVFLMLILLLVSAVYVIAEADHECAGEDCPVCACIRQCENNLGLLRDGTARHTAFCALYALILLPLLFAVRTVHTDVMRPKLVRLNN